MEKAIRLYIPTKKKPRQQQKKNSQFKRKQAL